MSEWCAREQLDDTVVFEHSDRELVGARADEYEEGMGIDVDVEEADQR